VTFVKMYTMLKVDLRYG